MVQVCEDLLLVLGAVVIACVCVGALLWAGVGTCV